jgi:hypothetical protein
VVEKTGEVIEPTPITEPLDTFLREVVQTLHVAVNQGMQRATENPQAADRTIEDCEEILATIMEGRVQDWIG